MSSKNDFLDYRSAWLAHYGVLGMKWGVRKDRYRSGHTIKKGTIMYRTSVNKNESLDGAKYVTYLKVDRDHYRGDWLNTIKKNGNSKDAYEHKYRLDKDLNIPSREEVMEVTNMFRNDKNIQKSNVDIQYKHIGKNKLMDEVERDFLYNDDFYNRVCKTKLSKINRDPDKYEKEVYNILNKELDNRSKKWKESEVKKYKDMPISEVYRQTTQAFGESDYTKTKVINELKKRGYNAMVDEASVGGYKGFMREGIEPLIIFDGSSSLIPMKTKKISKFTENTNMANGGIKLIEENMAQHLQLI